MLTCDENRFPEGYTFTNHNVRTDVFSAYPNVKRRAGMHEQPTRYVQKHQQIRTRNL